VVLTSHSRRVCAAAASTDTCYPQTGNSDCVYFNGRWCTVGETDCNAPAQTASAPEAINWQEVFPPPPKKKKKVPASVIVGVILAVLIVGGVCLFFFCCCGRNRSNLDRVRAAVAPTKSDASTRQVKKKKSKKVKKTKTKRPKLPTTQPDFDPLAQPAI
jgi:hypothetical protein